MCTVVNEYGSNESCKTVKIIALQEIW